MTLLCANGWRGGLFNTLNHAKAEDDLAGRDSLLVELRKFARAYPDEAALRATASPCRA
jgi:hypothetical protein